MMPPQFHGQPTFPHMRHHTPSASPPITNGVPYLVHHGHAAHPPRGSTPQPPIGSRPGSRNDIRRVGPAMVGQPPVAHPGISYMPTPPSYPAPGQSAMLGPQPPTQFPPVPPSQQPPHPQQSFVDERRPSAPPGYTSQPQPPLNHAVLGRVEPPPPQSLGHQQMPPLHPGQQHISPPPPQADRRPQEPRPPPIPVKLEPSDRPQPPLLNTDTAIKKISGKKGHSIFTPIEENRSILSQHYASFTNEPQGAKADPNAGSLNRSQSLDVSVHRGPSKSPQLKRSSTQNSMDQVRATSVSSGGPESAFTPPSRSNSLNTGGAGGSARPRGPRLTVQIPDGGSEPGSAGGDSNSPAGPTITPTQAPRHNSVVLPPPSPSASALLSAGATGPPNPFARPPPQQNVNGETPVTAVPSRFLNHDFLPSPSSFFPEWSLRANDSNTLPSPLNFATPVVGAGPSFLREDTHGGSGGNHNANSNNNHHGGPSTSGGHSGAMGAAKRKSPDYENSHGENQTAGGEAKRVKV